MQNVLNVLRSAGLPKMVESTTLPKLNQHGLREVIESQGYVSSEGPVSFLLQGDDSHQMARVSAVFCKELVLSKVKAAYLPASTLHQMIDYYQTHGECEALRGLEEKYWVIPDLQDHAWAPNDAARVLVYSQLRNHYYSGSGLAICAVGSPYFGDTAFDMFVEGFKVLEVV